MDSPNKDASKNKVNQPASGKDKKPKNKETTEASPKTEKVNVALVASPVKRKSSVTVEDEINRKRSAGRSQKECVDEKPTVFNVQDASKTKVDVDKDEIIRKSTSEKTIDIESFATGSSNKDQTTVVDEYICSKELLTDENKPSKFEEIKKIRPKCKKMENLPVEKLRKDKKDDPEFKEIAEGCPKSKKETPFSSPVKRKSELDVDETKCKRITDNVRKESVIKKLTDYSNKQDVLAPEHLGKCQEQGNTIVLLDNRKEGAVKEQDVTTDPFTTREIIGDETSYGTNVIQTSPNKTHSATTDLSRGNLYESNKLSVENANICSVTDRSVILKNPKSETIKRQNVSSDDANQQSESRMEISESTDKSNSSKFKHSEKLQLDMPEKIEKKLGTLASKHTNRELELSADASLPMSQNLTNKNKSEFLSVTKSCGGSEKSIQEIPSTAFERKDQSRFIPTVSTEYKSRASGYKLRPTPIESKYVPVEKLQQDEELVKEQKRLLEFYSRNRHSGLQLTHTESLQNESIFPKLYEIEKRCVSAQNKHIENLKRMRKEDKLFGIQSCEFSNESISRLQVDYAERQTSAATNLAAKTTYEEYLNVTYERHDNEYVVLPPLDINPISPFSSPPKKIKEAVESSDKDKNRNLQAQEQKLVALQPTKVDHYTRSLSETRDTDDKGEIPDLPPARENPIPPLSSPPTEILKIDNPILREYPGLAEHPAKVKKDARYQKKFYRKEPVKLPVNWKVEKDISSETEPNKDPRGAAAQSAEIDNERSQQEMSNDNPGLPLYSPFWKVENPRFPSLPQPENPEIDKITEKRIPREYLELVQEPTIEKKDAGYQKFYIKESVGAGEERKSYGDKSADGYKVSSFIKGSQTPSATIADKRGTPEGNKNKSPSKSVAPPQLEGLAARFMQNVDIKPGSPLRPGSRRQKNIPFSTCEREIRRRSVSAECVSRASENKLQQISIKPESNYVPLEEWLKNKAFIEQQKQLFESFSQTQHSDREIRYIGNIQDERQFSRANVPGEVFYLAQSFDLLCELGLEKTIFVGTQSREFNISSPVKPGSHSGSPVKPGSHSGSPVKPGSHSGSPVKPGSHSGSPVKPGSHSGSPVKPGSHSGSPVKPGSHSEVDKD